MLASRGSPRLATAATMIGPTPPPHLRGNSNENGNQESETNTPKDDSDEDAYGPALPPTLASKRQAEPVREKQAAVESDSDSDEDVVGPQLPSASTSKDDPNEGVREFLAREQRRKALAEVWLS